MGLLKGCRLQKVHQKINHFFFANDSLIVMKATTQSAQKLQDILELYEA
jgi:hypothetical protein